MSEELATSLHSSYQFLWRFFHRAESLSRGYWEQGCQAWLRCVLKTCNSQGQCWSVQTSVSSASGTMSCCCSGPPYVATLAENTGSMKPATENLCSFSTSAPGCWCGCGEASQIFFFFYFLASPSDFLLKVTALKVALYDAARAVAGFPTVWDIVFSKSFHQVIILNVMKEENY